MRYLIAIISFFFALNVSAQCIGCPPLTGGNVPKQPCSFNGQTSSVTNYNGITPNCYFPTNGSLNGHLQGINNALCTIRNRIDSIANVSGQCDSLIENVQLQIDTIVTMLTFYDVVSSDGSIIVTTDTTNSIITFDLSVAPYIPNVDATCLIGEAEPTLDNILQALITAACLNEEED